MLLNLLNKPMKIFNMDETGVSVVHKGEKVVTEMGCKNVWALTSGEKGKTHNSNVFLLLGLFSPLSLSTQDKESQRA